MQELENVLNHIRCCGEKESLSNSYHGDIGHYDRVKKHAMLSNGHHHSSDDVRGSSCYGEKSSHSNGDDQAVNGHTNGLGRNMCLCMFCIKILLSCSKSIWSILAKHLLTLLNYMLYYKQPVHAVILAALIRLPYFTTENLTF